MNFEDFAGGAKGAKGAKGAEVAEGAEVAGWFDTILNIGWSIGSYCMTTEDQRRRAFLATTATNLGNALALDSDTVTKVAGLASELVPPSPTERREAVANAVVTGVTVASMSLYDWWNTLTPVIPTTPSTPTDTTDTA